MTLQHWTRRVLETASEPARPEDLESLQAALPAILARARRERDSATPMTTWDVLVPLTRRWLPALVAAAASLAVLAFLLSQPASPDPWESLLGAQAAAEAPAGDIVADAVTGEDAP